MKIKQSTFWWIGLGLIAVLAIVFGRGFFTDTNSAEANETTTVETFIGNLDATATASGQLEAQVKADLAFSQSGEVDQVLVSLGDVVEAGDPLVVLDTDSLERAVADAEQALLIQENNLARLLEPASADEVAAAEANVANAEARLADLLDGATAEEIAAQEAAVAAAQADVSAAAANANDAQSGGNADEILAAQNALANAQEAYTTAEEAHRATYDCTYIESTGTYDCVGGSDAEEAARVDAQQALANLKAAEERLENLMPGGNPISVASSQAALTSAQASLDIEEARLAQLVDGPSDANVAAAEASLANANEQLDNILTGATEAQIAQQELLLTQAQVNLDRAQNNLANATLVAPFDGTISAVNVNIGETVSGIAIQIVAEESLEVVLDVDEVDLGSLSIGQPATVSFETYPNSEISAEVVTIAPENSPNPSGTVVYEVNLALDSSDLFLLEGMTADARLITDQREGVLLVANAAIKSDRSAGTYSVDVVTGVEDDGTLIVEEVPVTIGVRDSSFTQITSGVEAGVEVAIGYNPPPTTTDGFFGPGQ